MLRLSVRRTRQFALLAGAICAFVLTLGSWLLLRVARSQAASGWLLPMYAIVVLCASIMVAGLVTLLFARILRDLIDRLRQLIYQDGQPDASLPSATSLFSEFEQLGHQIATDQQLLRRRNSELQVLATISRSLNRASALEEMLDTVLGRVSSLQLFERGYIALSDEQSGDYTILASLGYTPQKLEELVQYAAQNETPPQHICLPLRATSGVIGAFCLEAEAPDRDTQQSLSLVADVLATTVEKYRLLVSAQREVRVQKLLNEAGRVLTSTLDEQEVLTRIMGEVIQVLNAEAGSVVLVDEEHGDMYFAAAVSPQSEELIGTRMPLGRGIVGWAIEHGESVLTADARADSRFYGQIDERTGLSTQSLVCVPLLSKDKVIGAIEVLNPNSGRFMQHDLQLLESLSPQAAIAIENASLFESIKTQMVELERAQNQLLQAEKLSAIGRLVAGVAHELNNPLTAIVGYSQLLLETCDDKETCEDLERINREAQRSARIVQNLLAFARQQKMEKQTIDIGSILEKTIDLLAYQLEVDNITLMRDLASQKMFVLGDNYQLQQVFINLITNAHQAMRKAHGQGTLVIRSEQAGLDTVRIYFTDDGPGVHSEIANRIFDPFFTTKDVGEGTGLGLSICLGILQEHGGRIWLDEEVERGANFVVELPLYRQDDVSASYEPVTGIGDGRRDLSVLVVDDEYEIAVLLRRILEGEGHQVVAVHSGAQAQRALATQPFDLIVCDLKMPGMSGRDLYLYVKQKYPDLSKRMIFTTGDTVSEESWAFLHEVNNRFIGKPFKPRQVLDEISALVAG